ncbi:asparagine-linked glycosylation protein [Lithohypha guttulata]|nr:asparagine-linked glycosylation protein [Lithohypha guttulata]
MAVTTIVGLLVLVPLLLLALARLSLLLLGRYLLSQTKDRRDILQALFKRDLDLGSHENVTEVDNGWGKVDTPPSESDQEKWSGIIGFFHPFCNAGGGGERVLWAAIAATQTKCPRAICVVYTGDHEIERDAIIDTVKKRFDISLQSHSLQFVYLSRRRLVLASTWPHFTLLGQSIGSMILAYEAFNMLVPDIFVDTMGYAFAVAFAHYLFPRLITAAYVHYPTISTDMLESLDDKTGTKGIHSGAGSGWRGRAKKAYWHGFAWLYGWAGKSIDVVMCNSTWTANHIRKLWKPAQPSIVYPPCPVSEIGRKIKIDGYPDEQRDPTTLYVAQFRPEKNHSLILNAFAKFYHSNAESPAFKSSKKPRLILLGSVRANTPDEKYIYKLRLQAHELKITECTTFITDAPFSLILEHLQSSSISVNGMYAEHFGIGNVEGLAAGLIPVVHNSGGPKEDIVVPYEGQDIGFLCENESEYADAFKKVLIGLSTQERQDMRLRCRQSAKRFTDEVFNSRWNKEIQTLVHMQLRKSGHR